MLRSTAEFNSTTTWTVGSMALTKPLNLPSPDFNGEGFIDFTDFDDFTDAYADGLPSADFNRDGFLDFTDVDDFISATTTGC